MVLSVTMLLLSSTDISGRVSVRTLLLGSTDNSSASVRAVEIHISEREYPFEIDVNLGEYIELTLTEHPRLRSEC